MGMRDQWEFTYTAAQLSDGASAKLEHHKGRVKFWQEAKERVMEEIKDKGLEVSESVAGSSYNTSSRYDPQVLVRADLQTRLNECCAKIREHTTKVQEYQGWVEVLQSNPNNHLKLRADDYLFFFGKT